MIRMREIARLGRRNWKTLTLFEILFKALSVLIVVPLFWGAFNWLMKMRGYSYLTFENAARFFLNPVTIPVVLLILVALMAYTMIDIGAVIFTIDQSYQGHTVHLAQVVSFALRNAARAFRGHNIRMLLYVLVLLPFMNAGMASGILGSISVPEFIMEYIEEKKALLALVLIAFFLLLVLVLRWLYALHYFTLEGCDFSEAAARSARLGRGRHLRDAGTYLVMQLVCSTVLLAVLMLLTGLVTLAGQALSGIFVLRWMTAALLWFGIVAVLVIFSAMAVPMTYAVVSHLFYYRKAQKGEAVIPSQAPAYQVSEKTQKRHRRIFRVAAVLSGAACLGLCFLLCSGKINPGLEYMQTMEVTAHRGASALYPENTMAAFEGAAELGADWIELDVQQSRDGVIFVMHDTNFSRTCGVDKNSWETDWEEISRMDAGSWFAEKFKGEKVPLLSEVLTFAKKSGMKLNIELKPTGHETDFEKQVVDLILEAGMQERCVITSLKYEVIENTKAADPSIRTAYVLSLAYGDINELTASDCFSIEATSATETMVSRIHGAGKQLFVWTVDSQENMQKMIGLGVDNIITNDITLAKETIYESRYGSWISSYLAMFREAD